MLLDNSVESKCYQSLDDKRVFSVCNVRVKFNVYLSFSEMKRLYSIKFKKAKKEEFERVYEKKFQNSRNFPRNFEFGYCGSSDNPSAFIEKGKQN